MQTIKQIRYILEYCGAITAYFLVRILPFSFLKAIACFSGFTMFLWPPVRKLLMANLHTAFPDKSDKELKKIAFSSISNLVLSILEFLRFINRPDEVKRYVHIPEDSKKLVNKYRKEKKGVIFVVPHIGNWELAGLKFKYEEDIPFAVVVRKIRNPYLRKLIDSGRGVAGTNIIQAKGSAKGMLKALKEGYFIATLIDQNTKIREGAVFVDFFGVPVPTSKAPALFARKMNTPLIVAACIRKNNRYELFGIEIELDANSLTDKEIIQKLIETIEKLIREYPEQYLWFYKRFQYIPEDASHDIKKRYPFYAKLVNKKFYTNKSS